MFSTIALSLLSLASLTTSIPTGSRPQVAHDIREARCAQGILPTPKYGTFNASFTVCTEETIRAPMKSIYDALLDFRKYAIWNTFVVAVELPPAVQGPSDVYIGLSMNFTTQGLVPGVNTTSVEVITLLDPPRGKHNDYAIVAWESGILVQAEHPTSLTAIGNGLVRMVSWETYYTPTDAVVLPLQNALQTQFVQQGRDLKAYVESLKVWKSWS